MIEITYDSEKGFQTMRKIEEETIVGAAIETIESFKNDYENQIEIYKREIRRLEKELGAKEQECKELREDKIYTDMACEQLAKENDKLKQVLSEIKGNAYCIMNDDEDEGSCYDRAREIVDKIDEVLND